MLLKREKCSHLYICLCDHFHPNSSRSKTEEMNGTNSFLFYISFLVKRETSIILCHCFSFLSYFSPSKHNSKDLLDGSWKEKKCGIEIITPIYMDIVGNKGI